MNHHVDRTRLASVALSLIFVICMVLVVVQATPQSSSRADSLTGTITPTPSPTPGGRCGPGAVPHMGYLHTVGIWVEDNQNCQMRLAGVTWDGMQTTNYVPGGLDFRPYMDILTTIKQMGFNTVRIPLSDQLVRASNSITISPTVVKANPTLAGLHPLDVLDQFVAGAQQVGLFVILDNHFTSARPTSTIGGSARRDENTWTSPGYTQAGWIADWVTLAKRYSPGQYCGNVACQDIPTVIGFDLHNEPQTNYAGHQYKLADYFKHGDTWGPWPPIPATPDPRWQANSDWPAAATLAGDTILGVNPKLLIIVEGVMLYPDPTQKNGVEVYSKGGTLRGVANDPINFVVNGVKITNKLVYSSHEWGPQKENLEGEFSYRTTYKSLAKIWMQNWAFILHEPNKTLRHPIWLGEFNTCVTSKKCVSAPTKAGAPCSNTQALGCQGYWFQIMLQYLAANPEIGWSYYPVNGTNALDEPNSEGILKKYWTNPKLPLLLQDLTPVMSQPVS